MKNSSDKELKGGYVRKFSDHHSSLVLKVSEEGVKFRSYRNGTMFNLTPETTIQAQKKLGSDIVIPLDELLPLNVTSEKLSHSFERTHRWQKRSLNEHLLNIN